MPAELTPMMQQYQTYKQAHPDALLLFRMGDFYELFHEDAEIAAEEAAWMLQRRRESMEKKIGVISPFHEQHKHLSQVFKTRGLPETIDIGTVHTFQGQHKPFLILDLTVSSVDHIFINLGGTLEADSRAARLLNTALSRCRADTSGADCPTRSSGSTRTHPSRSSSLTPHGLSYRANWPTPSAGGAFASSRPTEES